jgi:cold shock protein
LDDDFPWIDELTHNLVSMLRRGHRAFQERNHPMPIGTVKFFNADKGYGFIQPEDGGKDSFVHISAVQASGMMTLDRDQRVSYEVETGRNGKESAVNLASA